MLGPLFPQIAKTTLPPTFILVLRHTAVDALKRIVKLKDNVLNVVLPEHFRAKTIELIVLASEGQEMDAADRNTLLERYRREYANLRFDITNLNYDRDELHGRD